jgi:hypothetical protein
MKTAIAAPDPDVSSPSTAAAMTTTAVQHPVWCSTDLCTVDVASRGQHEFSRAEHRSETVVLAVARVWLRQEPGQPTAVGVAVGWPTLGASGDLTVPVAAQFGRVLCDLAGKAQR